MDTPTPEQIDAANRILNPTGDPLGFNAERMLEGERQVLAGNHRPMAEAVADIRARLTKRQYLCTITVSEYSGENYNSEDTFTDASYTIQTDTLEELYEVVAQHVYEGIEHVGKRYYCGPEYSDIQYVEVLDTQPFNRDRLKDTQPYRDVLIRADAKAAEEERKRLAEIERKRKLVELESKLTPEELNIIRYRR